MGTDTNQWVIKDAHKDQSFFVGHFGVQFLLPPKPLKR